MAVVLQLPTVQVAVNALLLVLAVRFIEFPVAPVDQTT